MFYCERELNEILQSKKGYREGRRVVYTGCGGIGDIQESQRKLGCTVSCGSRAVESESRSGSAGVTVTTNCISCGRTMDRMVYFTMCPHCGHNYRIEICPVGRREWLSLKSLVPWFLFGVIAAMAVVVAVVMILLLM